MPSWRLDTRSFTVEAIVLQERFRSLFTAEELQTAADRLGEYSKQLKKIRKRGPGLFPDELPAGVQYFEGARKYVRVNAYERSDKARKACLAHYGDSCSVCGMSFEAQYGEIGARFIHVHHLKPLALSQSSYVIDPVADLRPVCPNCHAMLHRRNPPLSIAQLKKMRSQR